MTDIDPKALALRVAAWLSTNADAFEAIPGQRVLAAFDQDEARALAAFLREAVSPCLREAVSPWRPIETATGRGPILGFQATPGDFENKMATCWSYAAGDTLIWIGTGGLMPTHWMPLPPPPARIEDSEEPSHDRR